MLRPPGLLNVLDTITRKQTTKTEDNLLCWNIFILVPLLRPTNVNGWEINSTALWVTWDPMPNNREAIKGVIQGYEVYNKFWNYFTPLYLPWKMARFSNTKMMTILS